jgi:hypothetical protein
MDIDVYTREIQNPFLYFTFWSNTIFLSFMIWSLYFGISTWLFLFACSLVTATSFIGTFYITLASGLDKNAVINDFIMHVLPFITLLVVFNRIKIKTKGPPNFVNTLLLAAFVSVLYQSLTNFESVYVYDTSTMIILFFCLFFSSYYVYARLL